MVLRAYRYRFYPSEELVLFLSKTFGCCRFVYNHFLTVKQKHYENHKKTLSYGECAEQLAELKDQEVFLKEVSSVALQQALRHLESGFQRFYKKLGAFPTYKKRHSKQSASFMKNAFSFNNGEIFLAKHKEALPIRWSRRFQGEPHSITISKDQNGRYYISILVEEFIKPLVSLTKTIGVDLGLTHAIVTSDGTKEKPQLFLKTQLQRLRRRQQALSRKNKGSSNRGKAQRRIASLCAKIKDRRMDYLHKRSRQLVNENQVICAENLSVKNMIKDKRYARGIADAGWGSFLQLLKYKSQWYGRQFVQVPRFFPSSKQCSECKKINQALTVSDRMWVCPGCHKQHDRDITAAMNIEEEGLRLINWSTVGHTGLQACGADVRPTWQARG